MCKHCNLCTNWYNLEDFEPSSEIFKIMEEKGLCFSCAFWTWRLAEDKALQLLHDSKDLFLAKLRKEGVDDMAPWESFEQSEDTLLKRYPKWWFGRPVIIKNDHWVFHEGFNKTAIPFDRYNSILLDDGTIIPTMMSRGTIGGLTYQGNIPERFMDYPSILDDVPLKDYSSNHNEKGFSPNAIYLTNENEECIRSLIGIDLTKSYYFTEGLVPKKFVKLLFKKFYN